MILCWTEEILVYRDNFTKPFWKQLIQLHWMFGHSCLLHKLHRCPRNSPGLYQLFTALNTALILHCFVVFVVEGSGDIANNLEPFGRSSENCLETF